MKVQQLIDEARSLPVEDRAAVVDVLLRSMSKTDSEVERTWVQEAKKRLGTIKYGNDPHFPSNADRISEN